MTISHHPSDALLTAAAAGTLGLGEHIAVATHAQSCPRCRQWMRMTETLGGAVLENIPPVPMIGDAGSLLETRPEPPLATALPPSPALANVASLPAFVRRYAVGEWSWVAPGLSLRPLHVPDADNVRVFLLKSKPGLKLLPHRHTGTEMTCVLTGSFSHDGARFGPGDFDLGDAAVDHTIAIGTESECLCLVTMTGALRLKGFLGRLLQPLVAI
jgi:putative transcriptional regulator